MRRRARLPAPARTAAPPTPKSRPSCRPEVPPPPVWGAAAGYERECDAGAEDGADVNEADGEAVGDAEGEAEADAAPDGDASGDAEALAPLAGPVADAEGFAPGENIAG